MFEGSSKLKILFRNSLHRIFRSLKHAIFKMQDNISTARIYEIVSPYFFAAYAQNTTLRII